VFVVKFCCFHFADSDSETLDGSTSYMTPIVTVASFIAGFTVLIICTFCCPRRRGGSGSQVVFVDFFCDFLQFLSVEYIVLACTHMHTHTATVCYWTSVLELLQDRQKKAFMGNWSRVKPTVS